MSITDEERTAAMRIARTLASELSVYYDAKIVRGIEEDNLFDLLRAEIEEGRELYRRRVSAEVSAGTNYFERAIADVLLRDRAHLRSKLW